MSGDDVDAEWQAIKADPAFGALPFPKQVAVTHNFFHQRAAPLIHPEKVGEARDAFMRENFDPGALSAAHHITSAWDAAKMPFDKARELPMRALELGQKDLPVMADLAKWQQELPEKDLEGASYIGKELGLPESVSKAVGLGAGLTAEAASIAAPIPKNLNETALMTAPALLGPAAQPLLKMGPKVPMPWLKDPLGEAAAGIAAKGPGWEAGDMARKLPDNPPQPAVTPEQVQDAVAKAPDFVRRRADRIIKMPGDDAAKVGALKEMLTQAIPEAMDRPLTVERVKEIAGAMKMHPDDLAGMAKAYGGPEAEFWNQAEKYYDSVQNQAADRGEAMKAFNDELTTSARKMQLSGYMKRALMPDDMKLIEQTNAGMNNRILTPEEVTQLRSVYKEDPIRAHQLALGMLDRTAGQRLMGTYVGNLLSNPTGTPLRIVLDSGSKLALDLPVKGLASGIDFARSVWTGTPQERFLKAETMGRLAGYTHGAPDAVRKAVTALFTGVTPADLEDVTVRGSMAPAKTILGKPAQFGQRMTTAAHLIPRLMAVEGERYTEAMNLAMKDLKANLIKPGQVGERAAKYLANPRKSAVDEAEFAGLKNAYQEKSHIIGTKTPEREDALFSGFKQSLNSDWGLHRLHPQLKGFAPGRLLIPFYNVTVNRPLQALEWTPLGLARMAGASTKEKEDIGARMILGAGAGYWFTSKLLKGEAWGNGPMGMSASEMKQWQHDHGNMQAGMRIGMPGGGFRNVQYNHFGSLGLALESWANVIDQYKYNKKMPGGQDVAKLILNFGKAFTDASYTKQMYDLFEIPRQLENKAVSGTAVNAAAGVAKGFIPGSSALRMAAHATDPTMRAPLDAGSAGERFANSVYADIPGLSKSVPAKRDLTGQPIQRPGGVYQPVQQGPVKTTPVDELLTKLSQYSPDPGETEAAAAEKRDVENKNYTLPTLQKSLFKHTLSADQFSEYQKEAGRARMEVLRQFSSMRQLPANVLRGAVKDAIRDSDSSVKEMLADKWGIERP